MLLLCSKCIDGLRLLQTLCLLTSQQAGPGMQQGVHVIKITFVLFDSPIFVAAGPCVSMIEFHKVNPS